MFQDSPSIFCFWINQHITPVGCKPLVPLLYWWGTGGRGWVYHLMAWLVSRTIRMRIQPIWLQIWLCLQLPYAMPGHDHKKTKDNCNVGDAWLRHTQSLIGTKGTGDESGGFPKGAMFGWGSGTKGNWEGTLVGLLSQKHEDTRGTEAVCSH